MAQKQKRTETKMIRDIAAFMAINEGPFTKRMIAAALKYTYPDMSYRELMNEISWAIITDKASNQRFKVVRVNVWDLRERAT